jgi:hypothetical protein
MFYILIIPFVVHYTVSEAGYVSFIRLQVKVYNSDGSPDIFGLIPWKRVRCEETWEVSKTSVINIPISYTILRNL